jgi:hypothetical protein
MSPLRLPVAVLLLVASPAGRAALAQPRPAAVVTRSVGPCPPIEDLPSGSIQGSLYYPARVQPPLTVAALRVDAPGCAYYVVTSAGQDRYALNGLPDGHYHVVAWATASTGAERRGAFTDSVTCMEACGHRGRCCEGAHHVLLAVPVDRGRATRHVALADWSTGDAGASPFPPRPAGVPPAPAPGR